MLLSSGYRSATRHASLGAAVSWSFDLLDEQLREIFVAVSVFAGSFKAADAAAVCAVDLSTADAALAQLTDRSLVMRAREGRFVLLETLRAFGAEQLAGTRQLDLVRERHAHHFVEWIARADQRLLEPGARAIAEIDATIPELRAAVDWLVNHRRAEPAGRLVVSLLDYGILRLRPDVLAWASPVTDCDPDDRSPYAPVVWAAAAYATWMSGDVPGAGQRAARALAAAERAGGAIPGEVFTIEGTVALVEGRLDEALEWYRRGMDACADDRSWQLMVSSSSLLALGYSGERSVAERSSALLNEIADDVTPYAAYAWYCAGEALAVDPSTAQVRFARALELAELTGASFVTGLAGASKASIDGRVGDPVAAAREYRWLIDHWRRAGMWSTQWTMLRSIAGLFARLGRHRDAAVLVGSVRATASGHRIFGTDERDLGRLEKQLRDTLGDAAYAAARAEGATLDGDAAVEHALRAL